MHLRWMAEFVLHTGVREEDMSRIYFDLNKTRKLMLRVVSVCNFKSQVRNSKCAFCKIRTKAPWNQSADR